MSDETQLFDLAEWGPPLLVMGAALLGGGFLATRLRRDPSAEKQVHDEGHRMDLENRRDEALQMLAALESQKATMNPEDYAAERKALLALGSNAMRELDDQPRAPAPAGSANDEAIQALTDALKRGELDHLTYAKAIAALGPAQPSPEPAAPAAPAAPAPAAPAPVARPPSASSAAPPPGGLSPAWQGAIYALVGAGLIGGILYFIQDASQPRRDGASMTGNQDLGGGQAPPAGQANPGGRPPWVDQEIKRAEAALEKDPNDITALNTLTQLSLQTPNVAWQHNEAARKVDPKDPDARMFEAVITSIMNMPDKAQEKFDALLEDHPEHAGAWAYKGLTLMELQRYEDATVALEKAKSLGLSDHAIDNALAAAKNGGVLPAQAGAGTPAPRPPAAPGGTVVQGTIDLDSARSTFKGVQVFVSVSDPSMPGPPVASVKLPPGPYPMNFVVTEADKIPMMGNRPIPANFTLKVRLDDDGNAMTRKDTDPQFILEGVSPGTAGVNAVMK